MDALATADASALALYQEDPAKARAWLTEFSNNTAINTFVTWLEFGDRLVAKYADGGYNYPGKLNVKVGYPQDWLKTTSWPTGPISYEKTSQ